MGVLRDSRLNFAWQKNTRWVPCMIFLTLVKFQFFCNSKCVTSTPKMHNNERGRILRIDSCRTLRNVWMVRNHRVFQCISYSFLAGSIFLGAQKKLGQKNAFLKICSRKRVHCAETVHFSWPNGQYENCSTPLWYFSITDTFLAPTQNKKLPTDLLFGVPFLTPPHIFCSGAHTLWVVHHPSTPLERQESQLSNGVQNIKIGRHLPTEKAARSQKSVFLIFWNFVKNINNFEIYSMDLFRWFLDQLREGPSYIGTNFQSSSSKMKSWDPPPH